jgi:hypothetical protein
MIPDEYFGALSEIIERIPSKINWAIDGSLSLALQGIDLIPHDIDILTNSIGAYEIEKALSDHVIKRISRSSNEKYESDFGVFKIRGVKIEVMGDLRVFRNGKWGPVQNPSSVRTTKINIGKLVVPVVLLDDQKKSGYFEERTNRIK